MTAPTRRALIAGAAALAGIRPAQAARAEAIAGDRFRLGAETFILTDIRAPSRYGPAQEPEAGFEAAAERLQRALDGDDWRREETMAPSRWGERRVALLNGAGESLQALLATAGSVRINPQTDDHAGIDGLLAAESEARRRRRGLWALDEYRVFSADAAEDAVGAFHLVEGRVLRAERGGGRFYLNFGADYRRDFTASATSRDTAAWARTGFDLAALQSATVRVRGFARWINGPSISLRHPKQIEVF